MSQEAGLALALEDDEEEDVVGSSGGALFDWSTAVVGAKAVVDFVGTVVGHSSFTAPPSPSANALISG